MTIKEIRKMTGLSQSQFAKKYNISVRTLQGWEQGRTREPSYLTALITKNLELEKQISTNC